MLLTHHWLGIILLAVLISPACAAPTPAEPTYKVTVLGADGLPVTVVSDQAWKRIEKFIHDMWKELGDSNPKEPIHFTNPLQVKGQVLEKFDKWEMLYIEVHGGGFCVNRCYAYIVSPKTYDTVDGSFITQILEHHYVAVHRPPPPSPQFHSSTYSEILDGIHQIFWGFTKIKGWRIPMCKKEKKDGKFHYTAYKEKPATANDPDAVDGANVLMMMSTRH
ncbi:hypothetical protein BDP27DRAFT_1420079 [Rhodocollybia butyracea]|uniref:Uncharacterized protein n=1 Tax=Rhodocollybia butyracea TaxID=206335 RepID=A0A9P5PW48_9AGAR|nr:hypothetical protein BDP27DRAFT_1420079 [Rhodocollybia butyracea]